MGAMVGLGLAGALYLARTPSRAVAALALAARGYLRDAAIPERGARDAKRPGCRDRRRRNARHDAGGCRRERPGRRDDRRRPDRRRAHVDVRGTVRGNLVAVGRAVEVTGTVEGSVYAGARALTLGGRVGPRPLRGGAHDDDRGWRARRAGPHARGPERGAPRRDRSPGDDPGSRGGGGRPRRARPPLPGRSPRGGDGGADRGSDPGRRHPGVGRDGRRRGVGDGARPDARELPGLWMAPRAARVVLGGHQLLRRGAPRLGRDSRSRRDSSSAAPTGCGAGADPSDGAWWSCSPPPC